MTDLHAFKFSGELLVACFIGNILGNLLGNWRNRRVMRKYMPDKTCTCVWNKVPTPDSSASTYAYKRATDPNCPFHGDRSRP